MFDTKQRIDSIQPKRMMERLWRLVQVAGPTGQERPVALVFAELLREAGAKVEIDETLPDSPCVIGRLKGSRPGPTLQLAGHLDHIDIPHAAPQRSSDRISGRGAADMKNGLTGILEIVEILREDDFPGELLITAYGLHEAPVGDSRGLQLLIDKGIKGEAAIVFEGPSDAAAVMANGMAIWDLTIKSSTPACHELCTQADKYALLRAAAACLEAIERENQKLSAARRDYPLLPPASFFIGQVHYGDFYNRLPDTCHLQGTRRWNPNATFDGVKTQFSALLKSVALSPGITVSPNWRLVGDSYEISPDEPVVRCLTQAYQALNGSPLAVRGHSSVTDVCRLVRQGKIPAVLCGFGTDTGHADYEFVTTEQIVSACRVALLTVLNYLHQPLRETV